MSLNQLMAAFRQRHVGLNNVHDSTLLSWVNEVCPGHTMLMLWLAEENDRKRSNPPTMMSQQQQPNHNPNQLQGASVAIQQMQPQADPKCAFKSSLDLTQLTVSTLSKMRFKPNDKVLCYGLDELIFNARVYLIIFDIQRLWLSGYQRNMA